MTYCLAIRVDEGIVFASDTRTNAGIDYVSSYRKLHVCQPHGDSVFVIQSAGSLATTQELIDRMQRDLLATDGRESLGSAGYVFEAAGYLGRLSRQIQDEHAPALRQSGVSGEVTLILGGQTRQDEHGLFLVYPEGNYIRASEDTPFLQIGESKYGKPMLDRLVTPQLSLEQAARLALISLDATVRSNVTVGPPFDFAIYRKGDLHVAREFRLSTQDAYYQSVRDAWQNGVAKAFADLPPFEWESVGG